MIGIYKITSPSGRIYVGQSRNIKYRFLDYKKLKCKRQVKLYRSFLKYGVDSHTFEVIEECIFEELNNRERYWQEYYNVIDRNIGLNLLLVNCDDKPMIISDESREKIRQSGLGRIFSEESKKKMSEWQLGKKHSNETKEKISKTKKGVKCSVEHNEKKRQYQLGRKHTDETKEKMRISKTGYKQSKEHKENKRLVSSRIILNIETGIFYIGLKEAANSINMSFSRLQSRMSGRMINNTSFIYV